MELKARQQGGVIIISAAGRIDDNSANFIEVVGQCVREGYIDLLCNFREVEFIDYMGISAIVLAFKEVTNHKGRMKFCEVPQHLRNIFAVAGLDKSIEIFPTEELAVNSFKEDRIIEEIKKMQLRRRFKRLPIDLKIELKVRHDRQPRCLTLDIINLSAVGAYIFGCDKFKLGDEVILTMKLPPNQDELILEAKVVWIPDKEVQRQLHPGMGVEFTHLPPQMQEKLVEFIDRNISHLASDS